MQRDFVISLQRQRRNNLVEHERDNEGQSKVDTLVLPSSRMIIYHLLIYIIISFHLS